jgi:hypothetical protein
MGNEIKSRDARIKELEATLKRWEDKEAARGHSCHNNVLRIEALKSENAKLQGDRDKLLRACCAVWQMAVVWQPLTPGDIDAVRGAIADVTGKDPLDGD